MSLKHIIATPSGNANGAKGWRDSGGIRPIADLAMLVPGLMAPIALHVVVVTGEGLALTVALILAQGAILGFALRRRPVFLAVAAGLLGGAILVKQFDAVTTLLFASAGSHALLFAGLALGFGWSLRRDGSDLVTALARRIDPGWTPDMAGYTRGVTIAWTTFFTLQLLVSAGLAVFASREVWSFFVNILDLPLVALMFAGELWLRRHRYPGRSHVGPLGILAAMRAGTPRAAP